MRSCMPICERGQPKGATMSAISDLPKILKAGIKKHNVPGATVAIYRNGRVTQSAAGVLNIDTKVSTTTESVFQIGSITKV